MTLFLAALGTVAFVALFHSLIRKAPGIFYAAAAVLAVGFVVSELAAVPREVVAVLVVPLQRCYFAFALFALVMLTGVLARNSRLRAFLVPIRGELSILAAILAGAHVVRYAASYFTRLFDVSAPVSMNMYGAFVVAAVLVVLLLVLTITSLRVVKTHMVSSVWKKLQKMAYPFFALVCLHAIIALAPSAFQGSSTAIVAVVTYAAVLILYLALRIRRALTDGGHSMSGQECRT